VASRCGSRLKPGNVFFCAITFDAKGYRIYTGSGVLLLSIWDLMSSESFKHSLQNVGLYWYHEM
jgi:hypothetical protein